MGRENVGTRKSYGRQRRSGITTKGGRGHREVEKRRCQQGASVNEGKLCTYQWVRGWGVFWGRARGNRKLVAIRGGAIIIEGIYLGGKIARK